MSKFRISKNLLPSAKKIAKRGLYEIMWKCEKEDYKPRDYKKKIEKGGY